MSMLDQKKLLTDIKIAILSIYEHLENNSILRSTRLTKLRGERWRES